MTAPVIQIEGVSKSFPGVKALDDVHMTFRRHEIVGVIGENGSGKSTLLRILAGVEHPDAGTIRVNGQEMRFNGARDAANAGIAMVFQEQALVPNLTVAENVLLGHEARHTRYGVYRWKEMVKVAKRELSKLECSVSPSELTENLSFGERQMVEIARALAIEDSKGLEPIVALDEPTAVLSGEEIERLFRQMENLKETGTVVFVSHRLEEVMRICDRIYVMKDGVCVAERVPGRCEGDELYELMVGRSASKEHYVESMQTPFDDNDVVLSVEGLGCGGEFADVSFNVHAGEVLGLAGVVGSGREMLCRALFGAHPWDVGRVRLGGKSVEFSSPADAVSAGIGYVPAERRAEGIVVGSSVAENMVLSGPRHISRWNVIRGGAWRSIVADWIDQLKVRPANAAADVGKLSGGNQQKVVMAKWLLREDLRVLILDHPARGLDVGAKEEVYRLVRQLANRGLAILLIGDTIDETISMAHNVIVMKDGRIVTHYESARGEKPAEAEIVRQML